MTVRLSSVDEMLIEFASDNMSVPVYGGVPENRPAEFLQVFRAGGGASSRVIDEPLVIAYGWAKSRARAEDIAAEWRDLLLNEMTGMPLVRRVDIDAGPYYDPDPDSGVPRFTVTARMVVRGRRV